MKFLQSFLAAIVCFTRIPIKWQLPADAFTRASLQLPLLGWLIGGVQYGIFTVASFGMSADVALFLALVFPCLLSAGMHEDGLADFADGMLGGHTQARRLEIMKDPRVGTYGVLALIIVLGGGFVLLRGTNFKHQALFLLLSAIWSRSMCIPLLGTLPYLNHSGSRSQGFIPQSFHGWRIVLPLWPLLLSLVLMPSVGTTLAFLLLFIVLFWCLKNYLRRNLEGLTGDCLGAAIKLSEFGFYFVASCLWPRVA